MILGLIEHDRGTLNSHTLEMLTLARGLAELLDCPLAAIIVGENGRSLAPDLAAHGVSKVYLVQHERLDDYAPEAWAESIVQLIGTAQPQVVTAVGTERGNEVMAHVAARMNLPLAANCLEVHPGDSYEMTRVCWGGSLLEEVRLSGELKLFTVAPFVIPVTETAVSGEIPVETVTPSLSEKDFRGRIVDRVEAASDKVSLTDARVVVGGGRGVGSKDGFASLEALAELMGGAVGASRAVTNLGWRTHADQIGQTGTRIAPHLYIACGVSGAIQHMVGCKGAKHILAINTDPEAPIIAKADYAIIGDLHEVVPALIAGINEL
ncbi:MAG: electron transfer flavoprotein subunit alpha/FixB family protein [Anaerolineales bacterium]|nr:electron transfer flavoprotein subunit alpha/FixB family protein [Anaerolineales bacterium]